MLRRLALLMLAWSALLGTASAQDRQPIPELSEYLTDRANVFGPMQRDALLAKLERLHDQLDAQIVVLVVPTTQPESVEEYATRVFDQWRVGRAGVDNGVLFLVAVKDRRMRIEVGYGLEGAVTDVAASRILDQRVTPAFRAGNMTQGIEAGVDGIAEAIRQAAAAPASKPGAPPPVAPRAPAAVPAPVPVPLAAASVDAVRPATEDDLPAQIDPGTATAPASSPAAASRKAPSALDEAGWGAKIAVLLVAALIFVFVPPVIGGLVGGVAVGTVLNQPAMAFTGIFLIGYLHYKFIPRKPGASLGFDWLLNILLFIFSLMGRGGSGGSGGGGGGGGGRIGSTRGGGGRSGGGGASGSW